MKLMTPMAILLWFLGGLLIMFGAMIAGNADPGILGATTTTYYVSLLLAFIFILAAGVCWLNAADEVVFHSKRHS